MRAFWWGRSFFLRITFAKAKFNRENIAKENQIKIKFKRVQPIEEHIRKYFCEDKKSKGIQEVFNVHPSPTRILKKVGTKNYVVFRDYYKPGNILSFIKIFQSLPYKLKFNYDC